jgi:hypothetical protein
MSLWFRRYSPANKLERCDIRTTIMDRRTTIMDRNVILSFSFDRERLAERETALRHCGFEVISASTASHARFEIEMGRCGVLLICHRSSPLTACELSTLFRKNCPAGRIIFVMKSALGGIPVAADLTVLESEGPQAIVQALGSDPLFSVPFPQAS